jgi:hypothetical protein
MECGGDDGWCWAERYRHGDVTEDELHAAYDAVLDAWTAAADAQRKPPPVRWNL